MKAVLKKVKTRWINSCHFVFLFFIIASACSQNQRIEQSGSKFNWVNNAGLTVSPISVVDSGYREFIFTKNEIENSKLSLEELVGSFHYLQLKNEPGHFFGDIDKLLINDSLIFVLDSYISRTVSIYDRESGKELVFLEPKGEGPGEFIEIYDVALSDSGNHLLLYDGKLSKVLYYDFQGRFVNELRVPLRATQFRSLSGSKYIWYTQGLSNDHLLSVSNSDVCVSDSTLIPELVYSSSEIEGDFSDYRSRDYFFQNDGNTYYFPRFENSIYRFSEKTDKFHKIVEFNLNDAGLSQNDLKGVNVDFTKERRKDGKFYGFGSHIITKSWLGAKFNRIGNSDFNIFYNKESNKVVFGDQIVFDKIGLPFFSFPKDCQGEDCISIIKLNGVTVDEVDSFIEALKKRKIYSAEFEVFIRSIEDFEQPAVMFFQFNNAT